MSQPFALRLEEGKCLSIVGQWLVVYELLFQLKGLTQDWPCCYKFRPTCAILCRECNFFSERTTAAAVRTCGSVKEQFVLKSPSLT